MCAYISTGVPAPSGYFSSEISLDSTTVLVSVNWGTSLSHSTSLSIFIAGMGDTRDDLDVAYSSVPQNPDEQQKGSKMSQMLLWVVLTVVMYGIAAEAFFIYHLYHHKSVSITSVFYSFVLEFQKFVSSYRN